MTDQALLDLFGEVVAQRWCTEPYCPTCEPAEFRARLAELAGDGGAWLEATLAEMDLADWYVLPRWDGAMRLTLGALASLERVDRVLEAWLPRLGDLAPIADVVLYRIVRPQRRTLPVAERWIAASAELAMRSGYPPLFEHLILTLREEFPRWPRLHAVARRLRREYLPLHHLLKRLPAPDGGPGA